MIRNSGVSICKFARYPVILQFIHLSEGVNNASFRNFTEPMNAPKPRL